MEIKNIDNEENNKQETVENSDKNNINNEVKNDEEKNLSHRKELYTQEGSRYFTGNIFIPDDLETLDISSIV